MSGSWQFSTHDQFYIGDFNSHGKADLFVYNYQGWSTHYLGRMIEEGTTLAAD